MIITSNIKAPLISNKYHNTPELPKFESKFGTGYWAFYFFYFFNLFSTVNNVMDK